MTQQHESEAGHAEGLKSIPLLVLSALLFVAAGCASDGNVDNVSERPWNDTQGWQGGLPSGLNEGR